MGHLEAPLCCRKRVGGSSGEGVGRGRHEEGAAPGSGEPYNEWAKQLGLPPPVVSSPSRCDSGAPSSRLGSERETEASLALGRSVVQII